MSLRGSNGVFMAITERRLTAILAADVCDFSRMMGENEDRTIKNLRTCRELIEGSITSHKGNIFNTAGDSIVAEFGSVVDAVNCAVSFQETLRDRNSSVPETARMEFRVGINLGDIIIEEDNRYGDGINIAARLEGLSEPGGICISGSVYSDIKSKLNLEFGAMGEQVLKNIAQPVSAYKIDFGGDDPTPIASVGDLESTPIEEAESLPNPSATASSSQRDKPSIAVLPFDNMSNDPEQEYFTDGITEDIITDLSFIKDIRVIARNSTFSYKGKSPDIRTVGKELDVTHVLEGSVRKVGNNVRINAQLIVAKDNSHRWAKRYDGSLENIFELQSEIAQNIAEDLNVEFSQSQNISVGQDAIKKKEAYDIARRGRQVSLPPNPKNIAAARRFYLRAIEIDSDCAFAYAGLSHSELQLVWHNQPDHDIKMEQFNDLLKQSQKAHALDSKLGLPYMTQTLIHLFFDDPEKAFKTAEAGMNASPNDPVTNLARCMVLIRMESFTEAKNSVMNAIELDPLHYPNYYVLCLCCYAMGDFIETIDTANKNFFDESTMAEMPPHDLAIVIGAYIKAGQTLRAKEIAAIFNRNFPEHNLKKIESSLILLPTHIRDGLINELKEFGL